MKKILMFFAFYLALKPLIKYNYKKRKDGLELDEWHWADDLAAKYGYFVCIRSDNESNA
jgi:hypothetical protein